jgi:Putative beta barrel porin-7 (BBP7)
LTVFDNLISTDPAGTFAPGTALNVQDQFSAANDFEGGQFGVQFVRLSGNWTLDGAVKLGLGNVHETVNINGQTTITDPNTGAMTHGPGLLAQPSNDGLHSRNEFAFLPELELTLHYQLTNQFDLTVGYTFLCITRVARVGDQVDTRVDATDLPTALNLPGAPGNRPAEVLRDTSLWAQGISGGIELRF